MRWLVACPARARYHGDTAASLGSVMKTFAGILALVSFCFASPLAAQGEWRCDCTTIVDTCAAQVTVQPTFVAVTTDREQCARVDYFIDGLPFVTVVAEGSARENWMAGSNNARVLVQSCQVCRDNAASQSAPAAPAGAAAIRTPTGPDADAPLRPIVATEPAYPAEARARGIQGSVTVQYQVNPFGNVESPRVTAANPSGVFDMAALSAISRWRYVPDPERAPVTLTETMSFTLKDDISNSTNERASISGPQAADVTPANQCIKENVSYNYGEMIEVGIINACSRPLAVSICAVGIGAQANRWICSDTESRGAILVPPSDGRIGNSSADRSGGSSNVVATFFVARAPNTEYWWLACDAQDDRCRAEARRWTAALDRRTANMNPEQRTRLPVGRSY
jgi:TonB family protein